MSSPTFSPSPMTTSVVPSGPVAAVQLPLPSLAVHVISPATARVETRHSAARSPPSVFPHIWSIGYSFLLDRVKRYTCNPSLAHGMLLPTGSTPALTRDESKLHTTYTISAVRRLQEPIRQRADSDGMAHRSQRQAPGSRDTLS